MSAESPRKSSRQGGHVVSPQPVSDRSIIESVAGFINEVVPQAYTSLPVSEGKEAITWARFEYGDINDPALYPDTADDRSSTPPLLLVLGYGSGVQVWAIPANGEATEVLSWRQGVVRTLRVLPTPLVDAPLPDLFAHKRPLVALCDSAGPGPQFCSLSFISLRGGDQVKSIKFKNPVSDVLANRQSVVVTFPERIAVFDASTLEDRLTVTTCYPCPGPNPNPVALGTRWLAYSERRLLPARRSSGGTEGEGVQSYTATVLHAAKSLGKGLRELGETVASSLSGTAIPRGASGTAPGQPPGTFVAGGCDALQSGIITILDAQGASSANHGEDVRSTDSGSSASNADVMVAHFAAHSEPIVALSFDPSGMLLLTADKRGHDFHLFRVQPHPGGPSLAAVHHLYVLHRGDTTAKVQDIAFAADSRWVAVSTLRGTTHVFPITPYGGPVGIRTHATPHVVNRLSRFHRSAGLTTDGRNSPIPTVAPAGSYESISNSPAMPYPNPRLPPYPHPTVIAPLAQIRQPMMHAPAPMSPNPGSQQGYHRNPSARALGRTPSTSEEGLPGGGVPLRVTASFAPPRAWLVGSPTVPRESSTKAHKRAVDSLFVMACHGSLIEYDLEPKHAAGIPKEKVCDDTAIELEVQAKAQWLLLRPPLATELQPPLPSTNPLMVLPDHLPPASDSKLEDADERWLSQVEIVTHAGPHRRLWMGPQFTFKTYTANLGVPMSLLEMEAVEVGTGTGSRLARSNPVNMPLGGSGGTRPIVPVLIESGSASSYEQSPRLLEVYGGEGGDSDGSAGPGDTQLREDLADAMMESPGVPIRDTGRRVLVTMRSGLLGKRSSNPIEKVVNPVGTVITISMPSDEEGISMQALDVSAEVPGCRDGERDLSMEECKMEGVIKWPTAVKLQEKDYGNVLEQGLHNEATTVETNIQRTQWPAGKEDLHPSFSVKDKKSDFSMKKGRASDHSEHGIVVMSRSSESEDKCLSSPYVRKSKREESKKSQSMLQDQKEANKLITMNVSLSETRKDEDKSQKVKKQRVSIDRGNLSKTQETLHKKLSLDFGDLSQVNETVDKKLDVDGKDAEAVGKRLDIDKGNSSKKQTTLDFEISKIPTVEEDLTQSKSLEDAEHKNEANDTNKNKSKLQIKTTQSEMCRDENSDDCRSKAEKKVFSKKQKYSSGKKKSTEGSLILRSTGREETELESFVLSVADRKHKYQDLTPSELDADTSASGRKYKNHEIQNISMTEEADNLNPEFGKHKKQTQDIIVTDNSESLFSVEKEYVHYSIHDMSLNKKDNVIVTTGKEHNSDDLNMATTYTIDRKHKNCDQEMPFVEEEGIRKKKDKTPDVHDTVSVKKDLSTCTIQPKVRSRKVCGFLPADERESKVDCVQDKHEFMHGNKEEHNITENVWNTTASFTFKGISPKSHTTKITLNKVEDDGFEMGVHQLPFKPDNDNTAVSSSDVELPPVKTWSSIVSSAPKARSVKPCQESSATTLKQKLWSDIAATGLNPDVLVSTDIHSPSDLHNTCCISDEILEQFESEKTSDLECITSNKKRDQTSDIEDDADAKNNNNEELISETNFPSAETSVFKSIQDDHMFTPQRSWSSIVSSSPKAGTSSTEDCSGEYDSNESKEYGDLGLEDIEEKETESSKSRSSELLTANESLSTIASESSIGKAANEEDMNSEPTNSSSLLPATKKNRKTKKKRR